MKGHLNVSVSLRLHCLDESFMFLEDVSESHRVCALQLSFSIKLISYLIYLSSPSAEPAALVQ